MPRANRRIRENRKAPPPSTEHAANPQLVDYDNDSQHRDDNQRHIGDELNQGLRQPTLSNHARQPPLIRRGPGLVEQAPQPHLRTGPPATVLIFASRKTRQNIGHPRDTRRTISPTSRGANNQLTRDNFPKLTQPPG